MVVSCAKGSVKRVNETVAINKPTIIAFMPPRLKGSLSPEKGEDELVGHLWFAVEDTLSALRPMKIDAKVIYADEVTLKNGGISKQIPLFRRGQEIGAILVEPNRAPLLMVAQNGTGALQQELPPVAVRYWRDALSKR